MKKTSYKDFILPVAFFGFITFGVIYVKLQDKELEENAEYTIGVITEKYIGAKARDYVRYEYSVNNKVYTSSSSYMPHREIVEVGDTCEVIYATTNPGNSKLLKDEDGLLKIRGCELKIRIPSDTTFKLGIKQLIK